MHRIKNHKQESSLSVKQLIDERIRKIEEQQLSEINARFEQQKNATLNSIKVKTMKLENEFGVRLGEDSTWTKTQTLLRRKFETLFETISLEAALTKELTYDQESLTKVMQDICPNPHDPQSRCIVDVDAYIEDLLSFDQAVRSDFQKEIGTPTVSTSESEVGTITREAIENSIRPLLDTVMQLSLNTVKRADVNIAPPGQGKFNPRPQKREIFARKVDLDIVEENSCIHLSDNMALLKRLQDICEIEVQISRQIEDELVEIDNKYLKLIAEASLLTFKAAGFENPSCAFFLDELWTRRVIPAILRQNPFMIQDVINAINNYASVNYQGNKRIQKLIQIENSKSTYH